MPGYVLSCCSTADLSKEHLLKRDIHYICFHFLLNDKAYEDDLGQSISFEAFYEAMRKGASTKTSQVNETEFEAYFEGFLKQGLDLIHVSLSSGLSGAYQSAVMAAKKLLAEYPERKISVIDSLGASSGYGLLMEKLADLRDEGKSFEEVSAFAQAEKLKVHHWFISSDLTFYVKGGRISPTAGMLGQLLNICPLLNMDAQGKLIPREKIRPKKKVIKEIVLRMEANAKDGLDYSGKCFISHSDCLEDAGAVAKLVEENFPKLQGRVEIFSIGTTIGSHTGPGTVALFFFGAERK